jgi:hypothetical protein
MKGRHNDPPNTYGVAFAVDLKGVWILSTLQGKAELVLSKGQTEPGNFSSSFSPQHVCNLYSLLRSLAGFLYFWGIVFFMFVFVWFSPSTLFCRLALSLLLLLPTDAVLY